MRVVTYNIQYGTGLDGRFGLERIADAVRGADVIALQEVTRNNPKNGGIDMVAGLKSLLPDYFCAFGAPFAANIGGHVESGRAVEVNFEFGNMVLSKKPILFSRNFILPRRRTFGMLNLQRGALEAVIETPFGPLRFYCVHLDHTSPDERIEQLHFLLARARNYGIEGGALTGVEEIGFPEPPVPEDFVLLGDFNMLPGSPEYHVMAGMSDEEHGIVPRATNPVDAAAYLGDPASQAPTWRDPKAPEDVSRHKRIDYAFASAGLARRIASVRVDNEAQGSDHMPVWLELA
jgi:endonuclease/exonuclease/phosphatase family metal-dependent hydrolase